MTTPLQELLATGRRVEAEEQALKQLARAPHDAEALAALASLQLERGDFAAARGTLARAAPEERAQWGLRWVSTLLDVATGAPSSEALLRQCWADQPERAEVAFAFGDFLAAAGRPKEALPLLERALALAPSHWLCAFTLATARLEVGEPQGAIDALDQALRLNPRHTASYTTLARVLLFQGRREEARQLLDAALPAVDDPALVEGLQGSVLAGGGALEEGLRLLDRALAAHPDHAGFNADKARVLLSLGRVDELAAFCGALEGAGRGSTPTRLAWAESLEPSQSQKALALYRQVLEADPADWLAANAAGLLLLREPGVETAALEEARRLLELALERSGGRVEPALNLARALVLQGEHEAGTKLAQQVMAAVPSGPLHDAAARLLTPEPRA
ncbi:tetratricopeptide repeat protein [Corallococcus sp. Z5C101001]|uniref:tetratricopeptide repeat protein n=1 Tax=Corallococcus sp. Z5C101001 TaxID=2596829 RepID=UPI00118025DB|nr:tetratricopeptide repeat protein [Corallococcus sp. Z5C101001]TSC22695.1 tetratricopeptide repeat protein [Corallococcus sp. Z5C101001]